jgi:hypothetical protein
MRLALMLLGVLALVAAATSPGAGQVVSTKDARLGAHCDGKTADDRALEAANASAVASGAELIIACPILLSTSHAVTAQVRFTGGGRIVVRSHAIITLAAAPLAAADQHLFELTGGGVVTFAATPGGAVFPRWWGALGNAATGDQEVWQAIDRAYAANPGLRAPVYLDGTTYLNTAKIEHITAIKGSGRASCTIAATADATISTALLQYQGAGPFEISDCTFSAPLYDAKTLAQPKVLYLLRIGTVGVHGVQVDDVALRHANFIGGNIGVDVLSGKNVVWEDLFFDRQWINGGALDDSYNGATLQLQHIYLHNIRGRGTGEYCLSFPANGPAGPFFSPREIRATDIYCEGAGFITAPFHTGSSYCYDITGTAFTQVYFRGVGVNCAVGGIENKKSAQNPAAVPDRIGAVDIELTYHTNIDLGQGLLITNGQAAAAPDTKTHDFYRLRETFAPPSPWQPNSFYEVGDVVTANGKTYLATGPGVSAATGGPGGAAAAADGTVVWHYVEATPRVAQRATACQIQALSYSNVDCRAYDVATLVAIDPYNASDLTDRSIDLHIEGAAQRTCLRDTNMAIGTIDRLRLINPACRVLSEGSPGWAGIDLKYQNFTNFSIDGGAIDVLKSGFGIHNSGATLSGTISGTQITAHSTAVLMDGGTTNLTFIGGLVASATDVPFAANGTRTRGTIIGENVAIRNAAASRRGGLLKGSAAIVFSGAFFDPPAAALPTTKCTPGEYAWPATPRGMPYYCQPADTWH